MIKSHVLIFPPETSCLESLWKDNVATHRSLKIIAYGDADTERGVVSQRRAATECRPYRSLGDRKINCRGGTPWPPVVEVLSLRIP